MLDTNGILRVQLLTYTVTYLLPQFWAIKSWLSTCLELCCTQSIVPMSRYHRLRQQDIVNRCARAMFEYLQLLRSLVLLSHLSLASSQQLCLTESGLLKEESSYQEGVYSIYHF